jgi:sucrose-phosphate synthase
MVGGMCGNDNWINSYLDAILDAGKGGSGRGAGAGGGGGGRGGGDRPSLLLRERGHFSPARYFVEEVITGYDETDLYKTWSRVCFLRLSARACDSGGFYHSASWVDLQSSV